MITEKLELPEIKELLHRKVEQFNNKSFISKDPIAVPHRFSKKQDVEIAAFFAAVFAWGNRATILNKTNELLSLMDNAPYDFMLNHKEHELKLFVHFVHRTFNAHDLFYFIHFLTAHYRENDSLETAFLKNSAPGMKARLMAFRDYFFSYEHLHRTQKHIPTPAKNSACKRLNMFLRWMVRKDKHGVDLGIWKRMQAHELICPLDVHVGNVAFRLGLIDKPVANWNNAEKLTEVLIGFDPKDPARYDFALFGLGIEEKFR